MTAPSNWMTNKICLRRRSTEVSVYCQRLTQLTRVQRWLIEEFVTFLESLPNRVVGTSLDPDNLGEISTYEKRILAWRRNLPPEVQPDFDAALAVVFG